MKRSVLALLFFAHSAWATSLKPQFDRIIKSHGIPRADLGLAVMELSSAPQALVYTLNENRQLIPASVSKLATASAVLSRLGPSFKFQTGLWSSAAIKGDVLHGDLVLKGGGDPGFVSETMWFLVNEFTRTGIKKIDGDVVVDDYDFDSVREDPSRIPDRVDRAFDAPIGAMSFNWNSINIYVRPSEVGKPPRVILDPVNDGLDVENKARTVNNSGSTLWSERHGKRLVIGGTIGLTHDEVVFYKNIDDPAQWSGRGLVAFLSQRGITVTGHVRRGHKPEAAKLLAKAESKPIRDSIADMLKFSNNYVAEMLTKDLAAQAGHTPASLEQGMVFIRENLVKMGLQSKNFTLVNPSGLSRRNHMSAADLVEILRQSRKNFSYFPEMLSGFPLAGIDGTLKRRMKNTPAEGWVRAKTGSLDGAASLAGFAGRKDGSLWAFAFIFNGKNSLEPKSRQLFDALAAELVQQ